MRIKFWLVGGEWLVGKVAFTSEAAVAEAIRDGGTCAVLVEVDSKRTSRRRELQYLHLAKVTRFTVVGTERFTTVEEKVALG